MPPPPKLALNERPVSRVNRASIFQPMKDGERLYDSEVSGLYLQAGRRGRTYHVITQSGDRQVRRALGKAQSPTGVAGALSIGAARTAAIQVIEAVAAGVSPEGAKLRAERAAAAAADSTFLKVAEAYLADQLEGGGGNLESRHELARKLRVDLIDWHDRQISDISRAEVRALVRGKAQTHGVAANRLLSFLSTVFGWAKGAEMISELPTAGVPKPYKEKPRDRFLVYDEIAVFWKACDRVGYPYGPLLQFALTTGQRRGECAALRRSELGVLSYREERAGSIGPAKIGEAPAWRLPAERTKRKRPHAVPLSRLALWIIEQCPVLIDDDGNPFDLVFSSGRRGDQPLSGWSRLKERLDQEIGQILAEQAGQAYDPALHRFEPDFNVHDLRATTVTHLDEQLDVPGKVISRICNHAEGDDPKGRTTSKYRRSSRDRGAVLALDRWSEELEAIVGLELGGEDAATDGVEAA